MRRLRWLLPVAILAILGSVASIYIKQLELHGDTARPPLLADGVKGQALDWCYDQAQGDKSRVQICATKMNQTGGKYELTGLKLKLFHADATKYDLVTSDFAQFEEETKRLVSEGNVEITLAIPADPEAPVKPGRLLKILSSGVEFLTETGEANTTRDVKFEFDRGGGSSVGAHYNPVTRQLRMDSNVVLDWRGNSPDALPMHIEAGQAFYIEDESKVLFSPWTKFTREALHMESGFAAMNLHEGQIQRVDMENARGVQDNGSRKVDFGAQEMHLDFDEHMTVTGVQALREARLISTAATAKTTVTGGRMDLSFTSINKESVLTNAVSTGNSIVTAEPVVKAGVQAADTRILKSDVVRLAMRNNGEEIDRVETDGPGTLDFLPNRPEQPKRNLKGDRIWINYGAENRIDRFRSINATTRTEIASKPPRITSSKEILATFDNTGSLARLEQTTDFKYEEGDRRASAKKATLEQAQDLMTLDGSATTYDPTGKVNADRITLNQKTGDYTADGSVSTVRQPAKDTKSSANSAMLDSKEPMQATAKSMTSTKGGQRIHYEGDAKAWQGANRVNSSTLDIDQETHVMEAHGKVETQFVDKSGDDKSGKAKSGPTAFTKVTASDLVYNTETRIAYYTGGVHLERPGLTVDSKELKAYLNDSDADSSLDKAIADGAVKIYSVSTEKTGKGKRTRTGTSEHGEYYEKEQKVILTGGRPLVTDSTKRSTQGDELTWWANDDRLLVNGIESRPVETVLPKTTKPAASKK